MIVKNHGQYREQDGKLYRHRNVGDHHHHRIDQHHRRTRHPGRATEDTLVEGDETFTVRFSPVSNVVDAPTRSGTKPKPR